MGVDLGDLSTGRPIQLSDLAGKRVALDASNTLYQFLTSIRGPDGTPLKDSAGRVTSHLSGVLYRTVNLLEAGMKPVYVFDGRPHELKWATLGERRSRKEEAQKQYEDAIAAGDLETARTKAAQTTRLTREGIEEAERLLLALGIPCVRAPMEGEAQASWMAAAGHVAGVASQDFDCLLFGTPLLWRNLTFSGRRKLPKRQVWVNVVPEEIRLDAVLAGAKITQDQLIDVALLVGTDFNEGVHGIGPKTALKLVQEHGSVEGVYEALEGKKIDPESGMGKRLAEGKSGLGELATVRKLFREHPHTEDFDLAPRRVDAEAVERILCEEHQFGRDRVKATLERYDALKSKGKQKGLGDFT